MQAEISENSAPGSVLSIPTASDPDNPQLSIKRYEFYPASGKFELQVTNSANGTVDLSLVLKETLDKEKKERHQVTVFAYDGSNPPRAGSMVIYIYVSDGPEFVSAPYSVKVPENTPINTYIGRVTVGFAGLDYWGEVKYAFAPITLKDYGDTFSIEPITGQIFLEGPLDYETINQYRLTVEVRGKVIVTFPVSAEVTVNVLDVND